MENYSCLLCTQKLPLDLPAALGELHDAEHWGTWQASDSEALRPVEATELSEQDWPEFR